MLKTLLRALLLLWGSFNLILLSSAFAPQSPVLIYVAFTEEGSDIFAYDIGTDLVINLTNSPYSEWRGTWSETGLFAFTANAGLRETDSLFLSQDFAPPQQLESLENSLIFAANLAPNGTKMVYISSEPANYSEIFLVDLRSGEQINLSQTPELSESGPQWFGDEQLLFLREGNLYQIEVASQVTHLVIDGSFIIENALLSPDKERIAFHGLEANERHLYIAQSNGEALAVILLSQSLSSESLSWSPDSQAIAFTLQDASLNIYQIATRRVLRYPSEGRRISPLWSPDGRSIAFMENRRIYLLDWQTGMILPLEEERQIRPPLLWMP